MTHEVNRTVYEPLGTALREAATVHANQAVDTANHLALSEFDVLASGSPKADTLVQDMEHTYGEDIALAVMVTTDAMHRRETTEAQAKAELRENEVQLSRANRLGMDEHSPEVSKNIRRHKTELEEELATAERKEQNELTAAQENLHTITYNSVLDVDPFEFWAYRPPQPDQYRANWSRPIPEPSTNPTPVAKETGAPKVVADEPANRPESTPAPEPKSVPEPDNDAKSSAETPRRQFEVRKSLQERIGEAQQPSLPLEEAPKASADIPPAWSSEEDNLGDLAYEFAGMFPEDDPDDLFGADGNRPDIRSHVEELPWQGGSVDSLADDTVVQDETKDPSLATSADDIPAEPTENPWLIDIDEFKQPAEGGDSDNQEAPDEAVDEIDDDDQALVEDSPHIALIEPDDENGQPTSEEQESPVTLRQRVRRLGKYMLAWSGGTAIRSLREYNRGEQAPDSSAEDAVESAQAEPVLRDKSGPSPVLVKEVEQVTPEQAEAIASRAVSEIRDRFKSIESNPAELKKFMRYDEAVEGSGDFEALQAEALSVIDQLEPADKIRIRQVLMALDHRAATTLGEEEAKKRLEAVAS